MRYNKDMKNILIFGASIVHGVGGENGGWADKIKFSFHREMYGASGTTGDHCDIYELGVPGGTLPDLLARLDAELQARIGTARPEEVCILFSAGTNDSKLHRDSSHHLYAPDDFAASIHAFIHLAKEYSTNILGVGVTPVDEGKLNAGGAGEQPYIFTNDRIQTFEEAFQRTCDEEGVQFVPLFGNVPDDWQQAYLYKDGLHPNDRGHEWIRSSVEPELRKLVGPLA